MFRAGGFEIRLGRKEPSNLRNKKSNCWKFETINEPETRQGRA